MDPRIIGAQINSALYLGFVAWVGIMTGAHAATYVAIAAMGATYLSYVVQTAWPTKTTLGLSVVNSSIALGAVAGILLLV